MNVFWYEPFKKKIEAENRVFWLEMSAYDTAKYQVIRNRKGKYLIKVTPYGN